MWWCQFHQQVIWTAIEPVDLCCFSAILNGLKLDFNFCLMCHNYAKAWGLFSSHFWPLCGWVPFFQVDGAVTNIGSSLKQNHLIQI